MRLFRWLNTRLSVTSTTFLLLAVYLCLLNTIFHVVLLVCLEGYELPPLTSLCITVSEFVRKFLQVPLVLSIPLLGWLEYRNPSIVRAAALPLQAAFIAAVCVTMFLLCLPFATRVTDVVL